MAGRPCWPDMPPELKQRILFYAMQKCETGIPRSFFYVSHSFSKEVMVAIQDRLIHPGAIEFVKVLVNSYIYDYRHTPAALLRAIPLLAPIIDHAVFSIRPFVKSPFTSLEGIAEMRPLERSRAFAVLLLDYVRCPFKKRSREDTAKFFDRFLESIEVDDVPFFCVDRYALDYCITKLGGVTFSNSQITKALSVAIFGGDIELHRLLFFTFSRQLGHRIEMTPNWVDVYAKNGISFRQISRCIEITDPLGTHLLDLAHVHRQSETVAMDLLQCYIDIGFSINSDVFGRCIEIQQVGYSTHGILSALCSRLRNGAVVDIENYEAGDVATALLSLFVRMEDLDGVRLSIEILRLCGPSFVPSHELAVFVLSKFDHSSLILDEFFAAFPPGMWNSMRLVKNHLSGMAYINFMINFRVVFGWGDESFDPLINAERMVKRQKLIVV